MKYKHAGLMAKCGFLLVFAGFLSILLYSCLYYGGKQLLDSYFETSDFQEEQIKRRVENLQTYVTTYEIAANESQALTQ